MNRSTKNWVALLAMMMMLFAFTGCSDDDGGTAPTPDPLNPFEVVTEAGDAYFATYKIDVNGDGVREAGVNINNSDLAAALDWYYIVDMRSAADFAYAHIPGAVNVSMANLISALDNMPTDKVIAVVCYTGQTASFATSLINIVGTETGHKAVNLKFGMSQWAPLDKVRADGTFSYPMSNDYDATLVTTVTPKAAAGSFPTITATGDTAVEILKARAQYAADQFVANQWRTTVASLVPLDANAWYLVNYFSDTHYTAGHLPGAIQYRPPTASAPSEFVSTAAMNTLPTDKPIAIYCYTGQTSAQAAAYLMMAGYNAKSVLYGIQSMCYDNATLNGPSTKWSPAASQFPLTGTGVN